MFKRFKKISFQQFLENIEFIADDFMVNECRKRGIVCLGGDCVITLNKKAVNVLITLYGKSQESDWKKSDICLIRKISHFTDDSDTRKSLKQLADAPLKFKVEPPKEAE